METFVSILMPILQALWRMFKAILKFLSRFKIFRWLMKILIKIMEKIIRRK